MSDRRAGGSGRVYEPVADIAKGGMGRVELVVRREGSFARIYAMKRLHEALSADRELREMFLEEARIAGLIRHPNVVPVLDVGEDEQGPFLVMDFVEGVAAYKPLVAAQESSRPLEVAFCVEVARQAAHGLAAAHELVGAGGRQLSVVHRDVSPQNILLGFDGLVRVTDFGVARALDHRADENVLKGKIGYMSPEQLDHQPLDPRSDLFSFGIVLYELLASQRLYSGPSEEAFQRIRYEPPADIREVRRDVPDELAELLLEMLAKEPERRPAAARLVAQRLEAIGVSLRNAGEEASLPSVLQSSFPEEQQRQRAMVAAALERTRAEIVLLDVFGRQRASDHPSPDSDEPTTVRAPRAPRTPSSVSPTEAPASRSSTEAATVRATPGRRGAPAQAARRRDKGTPAKNRVLVAATAALLVAGIGVLVGAGLLWGGGLFGDGSEQAAAGPAAPEACVETTECRSARGAASLCNPESGQCESLVSDACPELFPADAGSDPDAIVFGTILDRTSPDQRARENAARLAVEGINRAGGLEGRRVMLAHCDTSTARAQDAADRLVRANVPAIIGPSSSSDTAAVFSAHAKEGLLVISPSATATQLEELDRGPAGLLWRTAPPDTLQASVIMAELRETSAKSLAVVRRSNDVYAQSLSVILQEAATREGLTVETSRVFTDTDAVRDAAREAGASSPDAVVVVSSEVADAAAFLDATRGMREWDDTAFYFPDAAANEELFALVESAASRYAQVRATRPAAPSTIITSEFASEYRAANDGQDPLQFSFTAHAYDATALVLLGAGYALGGDGELTGRRIAEGIRLMSRGSEEHRLLAANFTATIAALRADPPDVDVVGASGPLDYDPKTGELTSATYDVLEVRGDPPRFEVSRTVEVPLAEDAQ